jgi:hypothetical protein
MFRRTRVFFAAAVALMACGSAVSESLPAPGSEHCLDLVNGGASTKAVPVCVRAAGLDPENTAVKQALETARTEAFSAALGGSFAIPIDREYIAGGVAVDVKLP